ncbi:hypothetical protein LTR24_002455 [Lithohypha guttulata]|uniref:Uncharacterized protein n=1 Tax=Lithohypha guttulata TaxID=1690604 RepID=A0ABR0KJN0_9EURO|nr:hypothetical protein LTR24_002455 [Lithohypha guttulata]
MARSDEQLVASRRSAAICGTDRCAGNFARSSSMADLKAGSRTLKADYSSDLRRVLPSVSNLRNLAHNQDINARNTGLTQANPTSAMPQQRHHVASNLQAEHTYNEKKLRRKFRYRSYQDLHILSLYQEKISTGSLRSFARTGPISDGSDGPSSASSSDSGSSRTSSPAPKTPIDQRPQNEAENAKMRRAHARQVHVIEQRPGPEFAEDEDHGEEEIIQMRTTVLDRPGKPRLIQIHRPRHSDQSLQQNIHHEIKIDASSPTTPVRDQHEISSFSPYDTPTSSTPFSDLSRTASEATPVPRKQPRLSIETQLLRFQSPPLTPVQRLSADSTGTTFSTDERRRKTLADPFGSPLSHDSHAFARTSPPGLTRSSTRGTRSISERSQHSHIYSQDTYDWKLDHAISLTTKAIEAHATRSFDLDSSILGSFRTNRLSNDSDSLLMSKLNKVFPHSSHSSLITSRYPHRPGWVQSTSIRASDKFQSAVQIQLHHSRRPGALGPYKRARGGQRLGQEARGNTRFKFTREHYETTRAEDDAYERSKQRYHHCKY